MFKHILIAFLALIAAPALAMSTPPKVAPPAQSTAIPIAELRAVEATNTKTRLALEAQPASVRQQFQPDMDSIHVQTNVAKQAQAKGNRPVFDDARNQVNATSAGICAGIGGC